MSIRKDLVVSKCIIWNYTWNTNELTQLNIFNKVDYFGNSIKIFYSKQPQLTCDFNSALFNDSLCGIENPSFNGEGGQSVLALVDSFDLKYYLTHTIWLKRSSWLYLNTVIHRWMSVCTFTKYTMNDESKTIWQSESLHMLTKKPSAL